MRGDDGARPGASEFPEHGDEKLTALLSSNCFLQLESLRANAMDRFNLDDFREQLGRMKNMGSMRNLMSKIPGMSQMGMESMNVDNEVQRIQAIIDSMTAAERRDPTLIDFSRRRRIASGSGVDPADVTGLVKQFDAMATTLRQWRR
jgi:signal recognition particle subunit SRP54